MNIWVFRVDVFLTAQKSHIFFLLILGRRKKTPSKQLINTIVPEIQERFALTAGW